MSVSTLIKVTMKAGGGEEELSWTLLALATQSRKAIVKTPFFDCI